MTAAKPVGAAGGAGAGGASDTAVVVATLLNCTPCTEFPHLDLLVEHKEYLCVKLIMKRSLRIEITIGKRRLF